MDIEKKLSELYKRFEDENPPFTFSRDESAYNEGFYKGRLNAIEIIVRELTGKSGDEL